MANSKTVIKNGYIIECNESLEYRLGDAIPENMVKYDIDENLDNPGYLVPEECGKDQFGNKVYIGTRVLFYHTYWPTFNERYGLGVIAKHTKNYVYITPDEEGFLGRGKDKKEFVKKSKGKFISRIYV